MGSVKISPKMKAEANRLRSGIKCAKRTNILDLLDYRISVMECLSTPQPLRGARSAGLTGIPWQIK